MVYREEIIGNVSFKKIVKALTSHDQRSKAAIYDTSGSLVYDNFHLINSIVSTSDKNEIQLLAVALEAFLKGFYESHVGTFSVTNTDFGFGEPTSEEEYDTCTTYYLPQLVMQNFKDNVSQSYHNLLNDCTDKIILYQGHRVRVQNQCQMIRQLLNGLKHDQAYIIMDYKMKF